MKYVRRAMLVLVGVGFVALLAKATNWPFALFCYGAMITGVATEQLLRNSWNPLDVPIWVSSANGKLFLRVIGIICLISPLLIGIIYFKWWWGFVGLVLAGIGTAMSTYFTNSVLALIGGLTLCAVVFPLL